jgi:hypothetical protein
MTFVFTVIVELNILLIKLLIKKKKKMNGGVSFMNWKRKKFAKMLH